MTAEIIPFTIGRTQQRVEAQDMSSATERLESLRLDMAYLVGQLSVALGKAIVELRQGGGPHNEHHK